MVDSLAPIGAALKRLSLADLLKGLRQPGITVSHRGSEVLCCVFRNFHTASETHPITTSPGAHNLNGKYS